MPNPAAKSPSCATQIAPAIQPRTIHTIKAIKQSKINLKLVCFDCIYYIDKFITEKPLRERKLILNEIVNEIEENELNYSLNIGFEEVYSTFNKDNKPKNKKYLINYFTKPVFEGLMAKNLNGTYIPDTCRNRKGWIKLKKEDVDNTEYSINLLDYWTIFVHMIIYLMILTM